MADATNRSTGRRVTRTDPPGPVFRDAIEILEALRADLAWLYEQLLEPVERELEAFEYVLMSPTGPLLYVPWPALVRTVDGKDEYAVERFTFGLVPDLYLLQPLLDDDPSMVTDALILGDPDGSLPGARDEARLVHEILGTDQFAQHFTVPLVYLTGRYELNDCWTATGGVGYAERPPSLTESCNCGCTMH